MARNMGWILGGSGFGAVASLVYLALAARSLGPALFGTFALTLAYAQLIANLAQFRSGKAVIRYGSLHQAARRSDELARLFGLTAALDWGSALVGAVVAILGVHLAGPLLGWTASEQNNAAMFASVLLLTTGATATGMLRLFDRFDLLALVESIGPLIRLCGAVGVWILHGGLNALLVIWAVAAVAQCLAAWLAAILIASGRLTLNRAAFATALTENRRIMRFMVQTNADATIATIGQQVGVLAVGAVGGPAAAGAFRIASKVADGFAKPVDMIIRALLPEFARLVASREFKTLQRVLRNVTLISVALAAVALLIVGFGGKSLLHVFVGRAFAFANSYLWLLMLAAMINLVGFAADPMLTAFGKAGTVLRARVAGAIAYLATLALLLPTIGTKGAAVAAVVLALVIRGQLAISAIAILRRRAGTGEVI